MSTDAHSPAPAPEETCGLGEALQAVLCLLPAALLAWPGPGSFLRHDPFPHLSGAGIVLLATLPGLALLLLRGAFPGVHALSALLLALLGGVAWISFGAPADSLEAQRALVGALAALAQLCCASALGRGGRRILVGGLAVLALALVLPALADAAGAHAGALGNTGALAMGALPGALAGLALLARPGMPARLLGLAAIAAYVFYCARVPVIAGSLGFALAAALAGLAARGARRRTALAAAAFALAALLLPFRGREGAAEVAPAQGAGSTASAVDEIAPRAGDTGGFAVRLRIWKSSLALFGEHALLGVGPGQFAARFPPHRDPHEIELSSHGRALAGETEVEHPHNDWLLGLVEGGLILGGAWIVFLVLLALRAWRALGADEGLAAPALGLLAYALVHAPLTYHPLSASLAFACFGAVLARADGTAPSLARRMLPLGVLALCLVHVPRAWSLVAHGQALRTLAHMEPGSGGVERALERALEACPDSAGALALRARTAPSIVGNPANARTTWLAILELRPERFEAWMQLGTAAARLGAREEARNAFEHARRLDPWHPGLLQNLVTLEAQAGGTQGALAHLATLRAHHPSSASAEWISERAALAWLYGEEESARALLGEGATLEIPDDPDFAYARSRELRQQGAALLADALESAARRAWARGFAAAGRWDDAVRAYRQDLRLGRAADARGPVRLRLELAAALCAGGKRAEARAELEALEARAGEYERLPEWARAQLAALAAERG